MRYLTPRWNNIGDKLIYIGVKNKYPGGSPCFIYDDVPDAGEEVILTGTPWLWDLCDTSKKYEHLVKIKNEKKKAIGIGSCYPLLWEDNLDIILQHEETNKFLADIWNSFELITVRDRLAKQILDALGVNSILEPCPSTDLGLGIEPQEGEYDLYFIHNAYTGVSHQSINLKYWDEISLQVVEDNPNIKIIAACYQDLLYAQRLHLNAEYVGEKGSYDLDLNRVENMIRLISKAKKVISGRVHAAVPAIVLNKETYILPSDSRYLTCELAGPSYQGIWPGVDLDRLKNK